MIAAPASVLQWLLEYKYAVLFPISVVEGPLVTILAGFLASLGQIDFLAAYGIVIAGDLVGDTIYYWLGHSGRTHFIERWGHYVGVTRERIERLEKHFTSHSGKTLIVGKLSHAVGSVVLLAAGTARMPFGRYLWFNFVATVPKSLILLLAGYYFGRAYAELDRYLSDAAIAMVALTALLVLVYVLVRRAAKHAPDQPKHQ